VISPAGDQVSPPPEYEPPRPPAGATYELSPPRVPSLPLVRSPSPVLSPAAVPSSPSVSSAVARSCSRPFPS